MGIYRLSPRIEHEADRSWLASSYRGDVLVVAETEDAARTFANCAFGTAIWSSAEQGPVPPLPWTQPHLVSAQEISGGLGAWDAPYGTVIAPQSSLDEHLAADGEAQHRRGRGTPAPDSAELLPASTH